MVPINRLIEEGIVASDPGHGSPAAEYKGIGDIPYVRVPDIVNWEIFKNPKTLIPLHEYNSIKKNGIDLQEKDILYIRRGSYRIGSCAMVSKYDLNILIMREIQVFRIIDEGNEYGLTPYNLIYFLSHSAAQEQIFNKVFIDTTLPTIGDRWKEVAIPAISA